LVIDGKCLNLVFAEGVDLRLMEIGTLVLAGLPSSLLLAPGLEAEFTDSDVGGKDSGEWSTTMSEVTIH
jgi:hypothetical protein